MFQETNKNRPTELFSGVSNILVGKPLKDYLDPKKWHNQFRAQVFDNIDEKIFKDLYSDGQGAPGSSVATLVSMMVIKELYGYSDKLLFEQCRYNLLVRSALGMINLTDPVPANSTYYLFRKRIYDYWVETGIDLLDQVFSHVTASQALTFNVDGTQIRMDSKNIGSNIAHLSRYEIVHTTLRMFFKSLDKKQIRNIPKRYKNSVLEISTEKVQQILDKESREQISIRLKNLGAVIYQLINVFEHRSDEPYELLKRVFEDQYVIDEQTQAVKLRPNALIKSDSVQSPHDPDSAYRKKRKKTVKGYSVNLTETASDNSLNLITDVQVEAANVNDDEFIDSGIHSTEKITRQSVNKAFVDGAYQNPLNKIKLPDCDIVLTGLKGKKSNYTLFQEGGILLVRDNKSSQIYFAQKASRNKNSSNQKWYIVTEKGKRYFDENAIRSCEQRKIFENRTEAELNKRNNVEATIFHLACTLRNNKVRYRGKIKTKFWALCRCMGINLVRITKFVQDFLQKILIIRSFVERDKLKVVLNSGFLYQKV